MSMVIESDERSVWLAPPAPTIRLDKQLAANARRGITLLARAAQQAVTIRLRRSLLAEVDASSLIEGVNADPTDPSTFSGALTEAIEQADGTTEPAEILRWHKRLMRDHTRPDIITPGQYRTVGVRVGRWLPPPHQEVPQRMQQFHEWLSGEPDPLMRAVWGHRYFESIHPFADGNGRTGRMLIVATLGVPICISRALWWERPEYMYLLGEGDWTEWSNWMLLKIREEAYRTAADLREGPTHDTNARAARWLTQKPLPRLGPDSGLGQHMALHAALSNRIELVDKRNE